MDIVREIVDERRREGYPDAEEEQEELRRLGEEAGEWSRLARLLLQELIKGEGGEEGTRSGQNEASKIRLWIDNRGLLCPPAFGSLPEPAASPVCT